jgi:hypothetical protein
MKASSGIHGRAASVVGVALVVALGVTLWVVFFLIPVVGLVRAQTWTASTCEVLSSRVASHYDSSSDGGATYWVEVRYRWTLDGVSYTGDRYDLRGAASTEAASDCREIVRELPPGRKVTCYVNPSKPGEAVIDRDLHPEQFVRWALAWLLLGAAFFVVRVTVLYYRKGGATGAELASRGEARSG